MSRGTHRYLARLQGNTNSTEQRWYMETGVLNGDSLKHDAEHRDRSNHRTVFVREYQPADNAKVLSIFYDGLMEMIPDTAFRALRHHPESLVLYSAVTGEGTNRPYRSFLSFLMKSPPHFNVLVPAL